MILEIVCDNDGFISGDTQAITDHFTNNPTHVSSYRAVGDSATPTPYSSGNSTIPELTSDPSSPTAGQAWVLATPLAAIGSPIGILLALTYATTTFSYQFSYRTTENTTIRTVLS